MHRSASSDRKSVAHFQALTELHEREEHARLSKAERASASGAAADDENQSG